MNVEMKIWTHEQTILISSTNEKIKRKKIIIRWASLEINPVFICEGRNSQDKWINEKKSLTKGFIWIPVNGFNVWNESKTETIECEKMNESDQLNGNDWWRESKKHCKKQNPSRRKTFKKERLLPVISFDWFGERCEKVEAIVWNK